MKPINTSVCFFLVCAICVLECFVTLRVEAGCCGKSCSSSSVSVRKSCGSKRTTTARSTYRASGRTGTTRQIGVDQVLEGVVKTVHDGSLIQIDPGNGERRVSVSLACIDVSGLDSVHEKQAMRRLSDKIRGKPVRVEWKKKNEFGQILGFVFRGADDVNLLMLEEGLARYDDRIFKVKVYAEAQKNAQAEHLGLWAPPEEEKVSRKPSAVASVSLDEGDVRQMVEKSVESLLNARASMQKAYGECPALEVGAIRKCSTARVHTEVIADSLRVVLQRSRAFRVLERAPASSKIRQLRLDGTLSDMRQQRDGMDGILFRLTLKIKDVQTSEIVWCGEEEVFKEINRMSE